MGPSNVGDDNPIYSTPGPHGAGLPHAHDGATWRALACLPPEPGEGKMGLFSDNFPVIPRPQWKPVTYAGYTVPILDQGAHGSCVWHATCTALWKAWLKSGGTPHSFSPTFGYALGNGNRDAGMSISAAADIAAQYGNCLASEFPEGQIWKRDIPAGAYTTALRFRLMKWFKLTSFDEVVSAILLGFFPVFDVYVGRNFNNLDADGVPPTRAGVTGNHAQTVDGFHFTPAGRPLLDDINSWGNWGLNGRCNYDENALDHDLDAWCVQALTEDPQEPNVPPHAS